MFGVSLNITFSHLEHKGEIHDQYREQLGRFTISIKTFHLSNQLISCIGGG